MKYYGKVGYISTSESASAPGVYEKTVTERNYRGDVRKLSTNWGQGIGINDDLNVSHEISIVADPFAIQHFHEIAYIAWEGALWKVKSITVEYPRLRLMIGGVYNGQQA